MGTLATSWRNLGNACAELDGLPEAQRHILIALRCDPELAAAVSSQRCASA